MQSQGVAEQDGDTCSRADCWTSSLWLQKSLLVGPDLILMVEDDERESVIIKSPAGVD